MRIVGIDPGAFTGVAIIQERGLLACITYPASTIDAAVKYVLACMPEGGPVAVQVPFFNAKTPRWNPSPVSFAKHAYLCGEIVGRLRGAGFQVIEQPPLPNIGLKRPVTLWCDEWHWPKGKRPPSEHARDAAAIAREALRRLRLEAARE